jgi:hypothetical protein
VGQRTEAVFRKGDGEFYQRLSGIIMFPSTCAQKMCAIKKPHVQGLYSIIATIRYGNIKQLHHKSG